MPQPANVPPLQLAQALADRLLDQDAVGTVPRFVTGIPEGILLGPLRSELEKRGRKVLGVDLSGDAPEDVMHAFDTWYMTLLHDTACGFGARLDDVLRQLHCQTGRAIVLLVDRADRLVDDYHGPAIAGSLVSAFESMSRMGWGRDFLLVFGEPDSSGFMSLYTSELTQAQLLRCLDVEDVINRTESGR